MSFYEGSRDFLAFIVRAIGLALLVFGLWLALEVLHEAWQLYHEPTRIERFAEAIEEGSNIDRSISPLQLEQSDQDAASGDTNVPQNELNAYGRQTEGERSRAEEPATAQQYRLRLSYYVAWVIALMLLLLLARISLSAIRTGGELVLYETQMKRFARELVKETLRERHDK